MRNTSTNATPRRQQAEPQRSKWKEFGPSWVLSTSLSVLPAHWAVDAAGMWQPPDLLNLTTRGRIGSN